MAWFTRFTRFGDVHYVFGQEQGMTCGPSSALMCYTKITKLTPGSVSYNTTQRIKDLYEQWQGAPYDGSQVGTWGEGLVYALNRMNCGRWRCDTYAPNDTAQAIAYFVGQTGGWGATVNVKPVIVGVNWDGSAASHWVCIDTIRSFAGNSYATVCDPWDANVHIQRMTVGQQFVYDAEPVFGVDFGGTHYEYSQPSTGRVRQWPIIHLVD